jgi:hypothetical protein
MGVESLAEGGMKATGRAKVESDRKGVVFRVGLGRRKSEPTPVKIEKSASVSQTSRVKRRVPRDREHKVWIKTDGKQVELMRYPPAPSLKLKLAAS